MAQLCARRLTLPLAVALLLLGSATPAQAGSSATAAATSGTLVVHAYTNSDAHPLSRPRARSGTSSRLSNTAIAAAVLAALIALACLGWSVARMRAFEPRWTLSLRHAIAEAGFRASATWAEFSDWARLGR